MLKAKVLSFLELLPSALESYIKKVEDNVIERSSH